VETIFRGYIAASGSYVYWNSGDPQPPSVSNISIAQEALNTGAVDKGSFFTIFDLPNAKSSSNIDNTLSVGDYATVLSESSAVFFCTNNLLTNASWSQAVGLPTDFAENLSAWWESDRGITLSGSKITSWADWSENNLILTSSTVDAPVLLSGSSTFDKNSISFSGNQRMSGGDVLNLGTNSMTWFVVIASNPSQTSRIVDKRGTGLNVEGYSVANFGTDGNFQNSSIDDGANNTSPSTTTDTWGTGNIHILTIHFNRSTGGFRGITDRTDGGNSSNGSLINWDITNTKDFCVGNSSNIAGQEFTGEIGALICYKTLITGRLREKIEHYLRNKYKKESDFTY
jgi:hypothetical protein